MRRFQPHLSQTNLLTLACVLIVVAVSLTLRWQTAPVVREGWLDTDVYRFVRQAQLIHDTDGLPESDNMRWLPAGRDLTCKRLSEQYRFLLTTAGGNAA